MKRNCSIILSIAFILLGLSVTSCAYFSRKPVSTPNYYILDYLPATEDTSLVQEKPFNKSIEVIDTSLPRTYDRNQIVRKKSYMQITYFQNELWSTRLYDAVPNLLVSRLSAYNIFKSVSRDLGETRPDFFLESKIQNIEFVDGPQPYAFLRMELVLKDSRSQSIIFSNRNERRKILHDTSVEYLVQSFNEMIMKEADLFSAKCIDYLSGKNVYDLQKVEAALPDKKSPFIVSIADRDEEFDANTGELRVPSIMETEIPLPFEASYRDTSEISDKVVTGTMNELLTLPVGKWHITLGSNQNLTTDVVINPSMRTVVEPFWSEMYIRIIDESQTRVKMRYDIYAKTAGQDAFDRRVNSRYSPADEVGEYDYLWVMRPGNYLITVNGATPNSYRDFTTITLEEAKSYILTIVVNPTGERSVLVGAGLLESPVSKGRPRIHKGAVHTNINLSSNNWVDKNNPTRSISLSGEFDNRLNYDIWPLHYTTRSLYDLGFDKTTGTEFRVSLDDYSLKNALVFYPWKQSMFIKNLGLYGRGDVNTHFFNENLFFTEEKNIIKISNKADSTIFYSAKEIRVRDAFYPLRLKEGFGLTYRINLASNTSVNLRSGFGWQQDYENSVYYFVKSQMLNNESFDIYQENPSSKTQGLENSVVIGINNLFKFINISSTTDVLFPIGAKDKSTKFDSESLFNIKLYRNISMDIKTKVKYNKALRDYVQTDYSAFLRLSLYY
jgi:ABC-type uncharacterized transport system auxiliary subunit